MSDFIYDAIEDAGLTMQVVEAEPDVYTCTITSTITGTINPDLKWKRDVATKPGTGAPTLGNVLYHHALRAQGVSQYDDILDWSDDNKRDLNDAKTIPEFKQLVQDKTDLSLLLGEPIYQSLMTGLAISQAIHNAAGH